MLFAGLIFVVLGIASLLVPILHTEKRGIKAGDVNIGVKDAGGYVIRHHFFALC
jgi:hypothetical protein